MNIVPSLKDYESAAGTSIALGRFDGVHIGHREVIGAAVNYANKSGADEEIIPAVFTFEQSPHGLLTGKMVYSLQTDAQKHEMIESCGIKLYICPPFDDVREMLPEEFVIMLKEKLKARHISCGFNFTFGKFGKGNAAVLRDLCKKYDIELTVIPPINIDGEPVSSTAVRQYISNGNIERASQMLGYRFYIDFPVLPGDKRGRTLDFPTINQKLPAVFIHPKYGVYATKTLIDGRWYKSVSNVGIRPTVGSDYPRVETNILEYEGDLYGRNVRVEFYSFLRSEEEFSSLDELKSAIDNDVKTVRETDY